MENIMDGALDEALRSHFDEDYEKDPKNTVISHAMSRNSISDVVFNPSSLKGVNPVFSIDIKTMPALNQRQSGRCWIFAGLNFCREIMAKNLKMDDFELSQNYIALFDKIEKSNFAMESISELSSYSPNERVFHHVLREPVNDGGQWDMFVNLVRKYGLVPKSVFPETYQSNTTREIDFLINSYIRRFASEARALAEASKKEEIRSLKNQYLEKIYTLCLNAFGVPPKTFDFAYYDDKKKYHIEHDLTPQSFAKEYLGDVLEDFQSIINSPTNDKPFNKNFTVDYIGNVVEGKPINHLNLTMARVEELIVKQLSDGLPVWFGSDVSFYRDRNSAAWDDNALDYESAIGFAPEFEKAQMLDYGASAMNHAMLITGVDLKDGKPTRWKIENSWGTDCGNRGYFVMSESWFARFVYQAVVAKKYLSKEELDATEAAPTHLEPWDPMGTLAD